MKNKWLFIAAIFAALAVALGAFGAHGLKDILDDYSVSIYNKAVLYHMFHVVGLVAVGLISMINSNTKMYTTLAIKVNVAGWAFTIGILLFSGSLYVLAITGTKWLGAVTPFGGISFIVGWVWLAWQALVSNKG